MKKLLYIIPLLGFLSACYYDNTSELYPAGGLDLNCDTTDVTYTKSIAPIFVSYCGTNNSCHSASVAEGGVILDDYTFASSVDDQTLIGSIEHTSGYIAMPPTSKISDCSINTIKIWIQNGKPQ